MRLRTRLGSRLAILLSVLVAALLVAPATSVAGGQVSQATVPRGQSADLALALRADGTFRGARSVAGTVDAKAWTLVSNLSAGEPPRFAPGSGPAAAGPWSALGSNGVGNGAINNTVDALAISGSNLYVGGQFFNAGGIAEADYVARWNGSAWSALGNNGPGTGAIFGFVNALAVSGSDLYVGGNFLNVAGKPAADYIAKWNGTAWSALGSNGSGNGALTNVVYSLAVSGTDLYAGGAFGVAGLPAAFELAKWNGSAWSALGSDGHGGPAINAPGGGVFAIAVSGSNVYVGGNFPNAGGIALADFVAKWNGSAWSAVGSDGAGGSAITGPVLALAVSGTDLYVGGNFAQAAGIPAADFLARWNGTAWSSLSSSAAGDGVLNNAVYSLAVSGTRLYVGGLFSFVVGTATFARLGIWNGSTWSGLPSIGSVSSGTFAVAVTSTSLFVGGAFADLAGILTADNVAKWNLGTAVVRKPDGRVRLGTGALVGNNVYNLTGASQTRTGSKAPGGVITFGISVQNDGTAADRFKLKATGTATTRYAVKYLSGTTDITAAVVAGTYQTASLAVGAAAFITVKVTVKASAAAGSNVTRLVTISSVANALKKDAVKFIGKRA